MPVREALLGLLVVRPKHGYQLKAEYDEVAQPDQSLNIGQVYSTLDRLERDGLVEPAPAPPESDRRRPYRLTPRGDEEARDWFFRSPTRTRRSTSELLEKVLVAVGTAAVDPLAVIDAQRSRLIEQLQALRRGAPPTDLSAGMSARLAADWRAGQLEADLAWLDRAEQVLLQHDRTPQRGGPQGRTT